MSWWCSLLFVLVGLVLACQDDTVDLPMKDASANVDSGPATDVDYCPSSYVDLSEAGDRLVLVDHRCAEGALCGIPEGFGTCNAPNAEELGRAGPLPASSGVWEPSVSWLEEQKEYNPSWPFCAADDDCLNGVCLFEPGCEGPRGVCCGGPRVNCSQPDVTMVPSCRVFNCLTYCGCDGRTFEGLPRQPYEYPGRCR